MKRLLAKLRPTKRRALDLPARPVGPPPFLGGVGLGGRARQLAAYQGWVYAAVSLIAGRVSGVRLRLYASAAGGRIELEEHPLLELLARPNPIMTGRQFRFMVMSHLDLTGMAFVLVARDRLGRPGQLWPLCPADLLEIATGDDTSQAIAGFVFSGPGGKRQTHRPEDILYFRHPSPTSLVYGASPIEAIAHAYDIDTAVRIYQRNFFRNSARPEVVLQTDQRLTEEEARRILTRWNQKHQGLEHAFEPAILDAGLSARPLTYSAKDMDFMALAAWTQDNILAAYGVPAGKLGLVKDVNRANAQGIDITFNSECIQPRLAQIEDVLNAFLCPQFGPGLSLAHDNPVPSDRAQNHLEAMQMLDRGALTINEFRASLGRPAVAWGDQPGGSAQGQSAEALKQAAARAWLGWAGQRLRAAWPGLESRFHGWSAGRVAEELQRRPQLLEAAVPPGDDAAGARLKAVLAGCLAEGKTLEQTLELIAIVTEGTSK